MFALPMPALGRGATMGALEDTGPEVNLGFQDDDKDGTAFAAPAIEGQSENEEQEAEPMPSPFAPRQTPFSGLGGVPSQGQQQSLAGMSQSQGMAPPQGQGQGQMPSPWARTAAAGGAVGGAIGGPGGGPGGPPSLGTGAGMGDPGGADILVAGDQMPVGPKSTWFWHPQVVMLDRWLPRVTVVVGMLMLAITMSNAVEAPQPWWVWITRFTVAAGLYLVLLVPLAHIAIRIAAGSLRRKMPKFATWRTFASYTPALVITVLHWNMAHGWMITVIIGMILGLAVSAAYLLLLFRLDPRETGKYAGFGACGFVLGAVIAGSIVYVSNELLIRSLATKKMVGAPTESPVWPYLGWFEPVKEEEKTVKPKPKPPTPEAVTPPTVEPPKTTPPATDPPKAAPLVPKPENKPPAEKPTTPDPAKPGTIFPPELPPDQAKPPVDKPKEPAFVPAVVGELPRSASAILKSQTQFPIGDFEALLRPLNGENSALLVRRHDDESTTVEVYESDDWTPKGLITFGESGGPVSGSVATSYAISPDGTKVARLAKAPVLSIQLKTLDTGNIETINLNDDYTKPQLLGFARDSRILMRVVRKTGVSSFVSIATSRDVSDKFIDLVDSNPVSSVFAVNAKGNTILFGRKVKGKYNLTTFGLDSAVSKDEPVNISESLNVSPTGLAFAPDRQVISAFYSIEGGLLLSHPRPPANKVPSFQPNPVDRFPETYVGSAIEYSPDGRLILLYGDAVIDAATNSVIDRLKVPGTVGAHFVSGPDIVVDLVVQLPNGQKGIRRIKLDSKKIEAKLAARGK